MSYGIFDESYAVSADKIAANSVTAKISQKMEETEEEFILQSISPFCDEVYEKHISKKELTEAILLYREVKSLEEMGIDPYVLMGIVQTTSDIARKAYEEGYEAGKAEMKERIINTMENFGGGSDE